MRAEKSSHYIIVSYIIICLLLCNSILAASLVNMNDFDSTLFVVNPYVSSQFDDVNDWPMFRHDLTNKGVSTCDAPEDNTIRWQQDIGNIQSTPAIKDGKMYVAAIPDIDHSILYCIDIFTNQTVWETELDNQIISSPAVANGFVYIGSDDSYVYCFYAENGTMKWQYKTGGRVRSSPKIFDGSVFIGSDDAYLYNLNALTGELIWDFGTNGPIVSTPVLSEDAVYVNSMDGYLYGIDIEAGTQIWEEFKLHEPTSVAMTSSPCLHINKIVVGSLDKKVYCIDKDSGLRCWNSSEKGNQFQGSPSVHNGRVYIGSTDKKLYCLNLIHGKDIWSFNTESAKIQSSPAIADGKLFIIGHDGILHCLNLSTEDELWQFHTDQTGFSSPIVSNGKVFVGGYSSGTTGTMFCIGEDNKAPIANFSMEPEQTETNNIVYFNDSSYDEDGFIVRWDWDFGDGSFSQMQHPTHTYDDNGVYIVNLTVMDNEYLTTTIEKPITILNRPPVVKNDSVFMYVNSSVSIDVLDNDKDDDGTINQTSLEIETTPEHGIALINTTSYEIQYEPPIGYIGNDTFTYRIEDNDKDSSIGHVFINITKKTHPIAKEDSFNLDEDTIIEVDAPGILDNDFDPDDQPEPLVAVLIGNTVHGNLQLNANGSFIYKPDKDYTGLDSFTYQAFDGMYNSNITMVYLTIININDAPIAVDDEFTVEENEDLEMNVTENDIDVDGNLNISSISIIEDVSHGNIDYDKTTGIITYKPNKDYVGKDYFTYTIKDTYDNESNTAWVNITVSGFIEPKSKFSITPNNPLVNQTVRFKDESTDEDGTIVQWNWFFGDGSQSSQKHPTYIYETPGNYTVQLSVKDNDGLWNSSIKTIRVYNYSDATSYPEVFIHEPSDQAVVNGTVLIKGNATSPNQNITNVQIRIDQGLWDKVDGTSNWTYEWDTTTLQNDEYSIEVRCFDNVLYSNITKITITVQNDINITDTESPTIEVSFPTEGYNAEGILIIRGIAGDNVDVSFVEIRIQNQEWIEVTGTTSWSYELDTSQYDDGLLSFDVRSYDGKQYSVIERVTIKIQPSNPPQESQINNQNVDTDDDNTSSLFFFVIVISVIFAGLGVIGYVIKLQV